MNHKKAIAYIRVSTTHQDVERQRIKFKEYCKNNNLQANEEIIDFGISGAKSDRPGYLRLQALTGKDADILVVSELSRLSRHIRNYKHNPKYCIQWIITNFPRCSK